MIATRCVPHLLVVLALAALATLAGACDTNENGPPHPPDALDFPVGVTADPSGTLVWVVSGNFDLAHAGAAVLAIDTRTNTFVPSLGFQVGSFPGTFAVLAKDGRAVAGYVASRNDDHLYWVAFGGDDPARPTVTCPGGKVQGQILACPQSGARDQVTVDDVALDAGADPFGLVARAGRHPGEPDLLLSGGMADGKLATWTLGADGTPTLSGNLSLFQGLYGLAVHPTTARVYATSKLANIFTILGIGARENIDDPTTLDTTNPWVSTLGTVAIPEPPANDRARSVAVSADGTRLYAAYRAPDSVVVLDISDTSEGGARGRVLSKIPLANDPSDIIVVPPHEDVPELVYVSCYKADSIEVLDMAARATVGHIRTGRGPAGMALVDRADLGLKRLYVALFQDAAVGVVELDATSPFYHTEVAEIR